ncbi:MAG: sugar phosphate isomerase/epimerase [Angelakisella sp.]
MIYVSNLVVGLDKGLDSPQTLLDAISPFNRQVGIEFFVHSYSPQYRREMEKVPLWLGTLPRTLHGPFIGLEATSHPESPAVQRLFADYRYAFQVAQLLGCTHLVFHSNERFVSVAEKPSLQQQCLKNIDTLLQVGSQYGVTLLLENLALPVKGTPIFEEEEYLELFQRFPTAGCLIDMGHLHLAGWDAERVLSTLAPRIVGYHLHNNDGYSDGHCRIGDGVQDYNLFFSLYRQYTPHADLTLEYGDDHGITTDQLHEDITRLFSSIK